jgi:hypothetical protein
MKFEFYKDVVLTCGLPPAAKLDAELPGFDGAILRHA